ncbi:MAG: hypothetical protein PVSMB8_14770 [Vulcanimicrobiaceae bacterium]
MSITFSVKGERADVENFDAYLNLNNRNARDLLSWLGYEHLDLWTGPNELCALELGAACKRRLALVPKNIDHALEGREHRARDGEGPRVIECGRAEGYLHDRCADLLALCLRARDGFIVWV